MLKPKVLFEDTHLLVISKPAGLLSQGDKTGENSVVDWAKAHVGRNYVGLIHRLDRNTSGLMVLGKRTKSSRRLTESLQAGKLERRYLAWVEGDLSKPARWEHWLQKNPDKNVVRVVRPGEGQKAVLLVQPDIPGMFGKTRVTRAWFELETGRSHQIRAQSAHEGHPLLGDLKYGSPSKNFPRPALHSAWMRFPHPMSEETLEFSDAPPDDFGLVKPIL